MLKRNKIILILLIAFFLRTIYLGIYPNNLTNDELHFVLNAKSVFLQFSNLAHNWNPLSLTTIPQESSSELPFVLTSWLIGPLPLDLFFSKLIYVLFGVGTVYLIYCLSQKLFNEKIALLAALIFSLNPWSILVNRTAFDAPLAIFFYLLTLYCLLIYRGKKILWSFIPALIAFYCYIGTKVIFLPIMFCYLIFTFHRNPKGKKYYFIVALLSIILVIFYYSRIGNGASRLNELATPNHPSIINQSLTDRNQSLKTPLKIIFSNKYTVFVENFLVKYFGNFSPNILFLKGDTTYFISLWRHGYFYLIDSIFIILGLIALFNFNRQLFYFIISLIALSPIPEAIRIDPIPAYAFHSCFQYPFLCVLVALGIDQFLKLKIPLSKLLLIIVYSFSFSYFLYIYFYRYPVYQSEGFFFSRRLVSQYLKLVPNDHPIVVISPEPDSLYRNYLFNSNLLNRNNLKNITEQYQKNSSRELFTEANITFINKIPQTFDKNVTYIIDRQTNWQPKGIDFLVINKLNEPANLFFIINDNLCDRNQLDYYVHNLRLADFNLNQLNQQAFCQKYLDRPL